MKVIFSNNAYRSILKETYSHIKLETGGIFLGHFINDTWYIIEMIDPGYKNITREYAYFEYDKDYVEHLTNIRSREYKKQLLLLGLWHRHPSSMDTFSSTDDGTNIKFAKINNQGAISALVNLDPDFRLTVYHVENKTSLFNAKPNYTKLLDVKYGDEFIPQELLEKDSIDDYLQSTHTVSYKENENISTITIDNDIQNKLLDILDTELDQQLEL
jgi:integrative and conjugative element protein (TIGR02256 family)